MSTTTPHPDGAPLRRASAPAARSWVGAPSTCSPAPSSASPSASPTGPGAWSTARPGDALSAPFPPLAALTGAPWLLAGVVGGLVIRRPGAALFCRGARPPSCRVLIGTQWGFATLVSRASCRASAPRSAFALLGYGAFGWPRRPLAGALAAPIEAVYEWFTYWTDWVWGYKIAYLLILTASGAVIAGVGGWLLTRALAAAGALNAFPPGQEAREHRAV